MSPLDPARPLQRSTSKMMVAGVCGGLANWLGWDVTLVRVLYVLVTVLTSFVPGIVAYIILWLIMPLDESSVG